MPDEISLAGDDHAHARVEQALGVLMRLGQVDRPEAVARIRAAAKRYDVTVVEVAGSLLLSEGLADESVSRRPGQSG